MYKAEYQLYQLSKLAGPLIGPQFTCFTQYIVQILTQKLYLILTQKLYLWGDSAAIPLLIGCSIYWLYVVQKYKY